MLPRFHWGSVISLADGVFFNEECNYLNRSAKDALLLPPLRLLLLLLLLPASRFPTHLRGSSCKKKEKKRKEKTEKTHAALSATVFTSFSIHLMDASCSLSQALPGWHSFCFAN